MGAILAGGLGLRMGGDKAARELAGRPLAWYPAQALAAVCERVAVVAKPDSALPPIAGVERWDEPPEPRHPLAGIVHALERAGGPVLVCAADMPFVTAEACRALIAAAAPPATVAVTEGRLQPLLSVWWPQALPALRAAPADAPLTGTMEALQPLRVELPARIAVSVDTPEALAAAERELRR